MRSGKRRCLIGWLVPLLIVTVVLDASSAVNAQQPPLSPAEELEQPETPRADPVKRLRLMLLDLGDLREPESASGGVGLPSAGFRHTFGSQRQTAEEVRQVVTISPEALEADIVVLRGVQEPRSVRRMLPARDWRLVLSRDKAADKRGGAVDPRAAQRPTPAVALWLQAGVRFGGADPSLPSGLGVAMRVMSGLGTLWALSPSEPCLEAASVSGGLCKPLEDWISGKLASADLVLIGGVLPPVPRAKAVSSASVASAPLAGGRTPPAKAIPLAIRFLDGVAQLTGADAGGRCGVISEAGPALHLRIAKGEHKSPLVAGWLVPLDQPKPLAGADGRVAPPRGPACALLLDIEAVL